MEEEKRPVDDEEEIAEEEIGEEEMDSEPEEISEEENFEDEASADEVEEEQEAEAEEERKPKKKAKEPAGEESDGDDQREMYSITCSECGAQSEVPFKPDPDRPVYCRDCYRKKRGRGRFDGRGGSGGFRGDRY